jgi:hypothetical protein
MPMWRLMATSDGRPLEPRRLSARSARPVAVFELGADDEDVLAASCAGFG